MGELPDKGVYITSRERVGFVENTEASKAFVRKQYKADPEVTAVQDRLKKIGWLARGQNFIGKTAVGKRLNIERGKAEELENELIRLENELIAKKESQKEIYKESSEDIKYLANKSKILTLEDKEENELQQNRKKQLLDALQKAILILKDDPTQEDEAVKNFSSAFLASILGIQDADKKIESGNLYFASYNLMGTAKKIANNIRNAPVFIEDDLRSDLETMLDVGIGGAKDLEYTTKLPKTLTDKLLNKFDNPNVTLVGNLLAGAMARVAANTALGALVLAPVGVITAPIFGAFNARSRMIKARAQAQLQLEKGGNKDDLVSGRSITGVKFVDNIVNNATAKPSEALTEFLDRKAKPFKGLWQSLSEGKAEDFTTEMTDSSDIINNILTTLKSKESDDKKVEQCKGLYKSIAILENEGERRKLGLIRFDKGRGEFSAAKVKLLLEIKKLQPGLSIKDLITNLDFKTDEATKKLAERLSENDKDFGKHVIIHSVAQGALRGVTFGVGYSISNLVHGLWENAHPPSIATTIDQEVVQPSAQPIDPSTPSGVDSSPSAAIYGTSGGGLNAANETALNTPLQYGLTQEQLDRTLDSINKGKLPESVTQPNLPHQTAPIESQFPNIVKPMELDDFKNKIRELLSIGELQKFGVNITPDFLSKLNALDFTKPIDAATKAEYLQYLDSLQQILGKPGLAEATKDMKVDIVALMVKAQELKTALLGMQVVEPGVDMQSNVTGVTQTTPVTPGLGAHTPLPQTNPDSMPRTDIESKYGAIKVGPNKEFASLYDAAKYAEKNGIDLKESASYRVENMDVKLDAIHNRLVIDMDGDKGGKELSINYNLDNGRMQFLTHDLEVNKEIKQFLMNSDQIKTYDFAPLSLGSAEAYANSLDTITDAHDVGNYDFFHAIEPTTARGLFENNSMVFNQVASVPGVVTNNMRGDFTIDTTKIPGIGSNVGTKIIMMLDGNSTENKFIDIPMKKGAFTLPANHPLYDLFFTNGKLDLKFAGLSIVNKDGGVVTSSYDKGKNFSDFLAKQFVSELHYSIKAAPDIPQEIKKATLDGIQAAGVYVKGIIGTVEQASLPIQDWVNSIPLDNIAGLNIKNDIVPSEAPVIGWLQEQLGTNNVPNFWQTPLGMLTSYGTGGLMHVIVNAAAGNKETKNPKGYMLGTLKGGLTSLALTTATGSSLSLAPILAWQLVNIVRGISKNRKEAKASKAAVVT
jgi:hypothetical protein